MFCISQSLCKHHCNSPHQAPPPPPPGGLLWRMSAGVLSGATGAVTGAMGYGVGGMRWVAGKVGLF